MSAVAGEHYPSNDPSLSEKTANDEEEKPLPSAQVNDAPPEPVDKEAQKLSKPAADFPEGGLAGWLTVIGGSMVLFCTFGAVQSFGVYQAYYTTVSLNEHPASDISWIGSFQVFLLFALGLPAGQLFDRGYFHWLLGIGSLIYLFSTSSRKVSVLVLAWESSSFHPSQSRRTTSANGAHSRWASSSPVPPSVA
ncbi:hypothetical protein NM688_g9036 [Phlebia brevispora]|uniref:Uncharacterized protein n=1 Tax=Phlebia brevispora TaxID=194682 RepID=A0ACC1RK19_9APHY|nr:hypothetical protein NM688_g9036 [Phlebia brevispora]